MIWMWLSLIISWLKLNNSISDEKNQSHSVCIWLSITIWTILLYYHASHCNQLLGLRKISISEQCLHLIDMNNYVFLPCKSVQSLVMVKVGGLVIAEVCLHLFEWKQSAQLGHPFMQINSIAC